jgi:hypothetical protein
MLIPMMSALEPVEPLRALLKKVIAWFLLWPPMVTMVKFPKALAKVYHL